MMSSSTDIVIVHAKARLDHALAVLERSMALLLERYDFGFRGYGGVLALQFAGTEFLGEEELEQGPEQASAIDRPALEGLAARTRWFSIGGSVRIEGVEALVDLDVILYPTFDQEFPASVVFRLESDLYDRIYPRGLEYDSEAAERLVQLCVSLGAAEGSGGFQARLVADLGDIRAFDGPSLRDAVLRPASIALRGASSQRPGLVTGVPRRLCSRAEILSHYPDGVVFETTTGFSILSTLVDVRSSG